MSDTGYKKNWFKDWFGEDYLAVYDHRNQEDAIHLLKLVRSQVALDPSKSILDVGCGNARHAIQLAAENLKVYGIDLSSHLLKVAGENRGTAAYPKLIRADMRHLPFKEKFDLVLSMFTSFGYFENDSENQHVIREYSNQLKENGKLVIDYLNPEFVKKSLVPENEREVAGISVREKRYISAGRVHKSITLTADGQQKKFHESVRLYTFEQMQTMLKTAGLTLEKVFGEYDGQPFCSSSSRMIMFCKKTS